MKENVSIIRTPGGACLGERILIDGRMGIRYKAGRQQEDLLPEEIMECICGVPVDHIVFKTPPCRERHKATQS